MRDDEDDAAGAPQLTTSPGAESVIPEPPSTTPTNRRSDEQTERPPPSGSLFARRRDREAEVETTLRSTGAGVLTREALEAQALRLVALHEAARELDHVDGDTATDIAEMGEAPRQLRDDPAISERGAAPEPVVHGAAAGLVEELEGKIRELEARLRRMADDRAAPADDPAPPMPARSTRSSRAESRARDDAFDAFGYDPAYEDKLAPAIDFLYRTYFRVDVSGAEHVPREGACLVVGNHAGGPLPYDGLMLRAVAAREAARPDLRWLAEDFVYHLPFIGAAINRLGAVRACQENAERLLAKGRALAVFPEGAKGMGKLFRDRYKLQRFGRGGVIRLALRTRTPVIPCAIVGAEEANPLVFRVETAAKALGLPYVPVTPTFPALGPLGLLPAPTKWSIAFGEPILFDRHAADAVDDELLVNRLTEHVRGTIQRMVDDGVARRRSVWFG